jgi:RNA polymerase sigma-70 factor (ECF subfamily)
MTASTEDAFVTLVERHRNELRLHCYRMLGSSHDSDDMLQETMIRAWRAKDGVQDAANLRAWLYRIATNVCLDELSRRRVRRLPDEAGPSSTATSVDTTTADLEAFIEPCPDAWFTGVSADPAARYETRECVALAFIAVLQHLSATQRATLLLRDVVGMSAADTAKALELGVEAANSALFRARAAIDSKLSGRDPSEFARPSAAVDTLLARYLRAWNEVDIDAFIALLHAEVKTTMPPLPMWIDGRDRHVAFYRPMFAAQRLGIFLARPTAANGQPALAFYRANTTDEPYRLRAIQLVGVRDGAIVAIDHFMLPEVFGCFDLPLEMERISDGSPVPRPCIEIAVDTLRGNKT